MQNTPAQQGKKVVMDVAEQLSAVSRRNGEIGMARWVTDRLTAFVRANPLTMEATPQTLKTFLANLCDEMVVHCKEETR